MMLLRPNLLGFDEIHLTFGHQIVDRPQILDVFVRYEFRLDRIFACLGKRGRERESGMLGVGRMRRMGDEIETKMF